MRPIYNGCCRRSTILSVANWSGKMSVHGRTDIECQRAKQVKDLERSIGAILVDAGVAAQVFLMCQTRSPKVVEDKAILVQLQEMARYCKVGVSFSISTDILEKQRTIENGGLTPEKWLETMNKLRDASILVSAPVCPLMPFSDEFPARIVESAPCLGTNSEAFWIWIIYAETSAQ